MAQEDEPQINSTSYDFILQTEDPEPKSWIERLDMQKLTILLAALVVVFISFTIIHSNLQTQAANQQKQRLAGIAEMQTEIIRIAAIGSDKSQQVRTQARADSIQSGLQKSLSDTVSLMAARGFSLDSDTLNSQRDDKADKALAGSTSFGSFDRTFNNLIDGKITDYQRALLEAQKSGNKREQAVLQAEYEQANSILGLVDQK